MEDFPISTRISQDPSDPRLSSIHAIFVSILPVCPSKRFAKLGLCNETLKKTPFARTLVETGLGSASYHMAEMRPECKDPINHEISRMTRRRLPILTQFTSIASTTRRSLGLVDPEIDRGPKTTHGLRHRLEQTRSHSLVARWYRHQDR